MFFFYQLSGLGNSHGYYVVINSPTETMLCLLVKWPRSNFMINIVFHERLLLVEISSIIKKHGIGFLMVNIFYDCDPYSFIDHLTFKLHSLFGVQQVLLHICLVYFVKNQFVRRLSENKIQISARINLYNINITCTFLFFQLPISAKFC